MKDQWPTCPRDVLVLAGDIHLGTKADEFILDQLQYGDVIYVLGNHEYYKQLLPKLNWAWNPKNSNSTLYRINREAKELGYGGKIYALQDDGIRLGEYMFYGSTMWTGMKGNDIVMKKLAEAMMNDYRQIYKDKGDDPWGMQWGGTPITADDTVRFHMRSRNYLENALNNGPADVTNIVISHHLPSYKSVSESYVGNALTDAYASNLEFLMTDTHNPPALWIHGHSHESVDYTVGKCRVVSNPRGYPDYGNAPQNKMFRDDYIIEI